MKKFLLTICFILFLTLLLPLKSQTFAQAPPPAPTPVPSATPGTSTVPDDTWVSDPEVTFVGKSAARSGQLLDWALQSYQWSFVAPKSTNPLGSAWVQIRNIMYILSVPLILVAAYVLITTQGRSITITKFAMRFLFALIFVTLAYSIVSNIYQLGDFLQIIFLKNKAGKIISQKDLLYVGFDYQNFTGFRKSGFVNDESVFITLLLTKLTALTYYVMVGVLWVRKIILWLFLIISPIFPFLLLFYPVRNTAKIWIGEFFRWVMYAPLFALFLKLLVILWSTSIPLKFDFTKSGQVAGTDIIYPTAVNILLGGPGQTISVTNSVNLPQTFGLYAFALIMLWAVILLPWVLLQIFLDYLQSVSIGDNWSKIVATGTTLFKSPAPSAPAPSPPAAPDGKARPLPFMRTIIPPIMQKSAGMAKEIPISRSIPKAAQVVQPVMAREEVMRLTNLSVPKMTDIARFEASRLSKDTTRQGEINKVNETLRQIANPSSATSEAEREKATGIRARLVSESKQGNIAATNILSAAQHVAKAPTAPITAVLPQLNRVQTVSLEDYEAVKKLWTENYQNLDVPPTDLGGPQDRNQWIDGDVAKITDAINLLSSTDSQKVSEGMKEVSGILPFLLIGGFSQAEIITYLKAKVEAAKTVKEQASKQQEEEETLVGVESRKEEKPKEMTLEAEQKLEDPLSKIENTVKTEENK